MYERKWIADERKRIVYIRTQNLFIWKQNANTRYSAFQMYVVSAFRQTSVRSVRLRADLCT